MITENVFGHMQSAELLRMWGLTVTMDERGVYHVDDCGNEYELSERELVVFADGYLAGSQPWPEPEPEDERMRETKGGHCTVARG